MRALNRVNVAAVSSIFMICTSASTSNAQPDAVQNEISRFEGHWRVIEMVENGHSIPEHKMRYWLPGGGAIEIVDYTILFKSPIDGTKSTKTYRIDPTAYPKKIAILERDRTTGTGIYKFDQEKLVLCISNSASHLPAEFSAAAGSERTLIVLTRFEPGVSDIPGFNAKLSPRKPLQSTSQATKIIAPPPPPQVEQTSVTAAIPPAVKVSAAARILTDTEVRNMAVGAWRINDLEGSVDIVFGANGVFQTYRYFQTVSNFNVVFAPTPISTGSWSVTNGRLIANVSSSTRLDRVNQTFVPAVRSISATDMILVDHLGRVSRAVKVR